MEDILSILGEQKHSIELISRWNKDQARWEAFVPDLAGNTYTTFDPGIFYLLRSNADVTLKNGLALKVGQNGVTWPLPKTVSIAVVDNNTVIPRDDIQRALSAIQKYISGEFAPVWGLDATLLYLSKGESVPAGYWSLYLQDEPDASGAMGYHFEENGSPTGKIFTKLNLSLSVPFPYILSHEVMEQLVDFDLNTFDLNPTLNRFFLKEVCDPVSYAAQPEIDGQKVHSFIHPSWYKADGKPPYSHYPEDRVSAPFTVSYYGFAYYTDGTNWTQAKGQQAEQPLHASERHWFIAQK